MMCPVVRRPLIAWPAALGLASFCVSAQLWPSAAGHGLLSSAVSLFGACYVVLIGAVLVPVGLRLLSGNSDEGRQDAEGKSIKRRATLPLSSLMSRTTRAPGGSGAFAE